MLKPSLPTSLTTLHNNSKVTFWCEGVNGWLASKTLTSDDLEVLGLSRTCSPIVDNFERAVFQIRSVDRWSVGSSAELRVDEDMGGATPIMYGQVVQLCHIHTHTWLCVRKRLQSDTEKSSFKVSLLQASEIDDPKIARFKILPRFKVRSDGEVVRIRDQILLTPDGDDSRYLHASPLGKLNLHEINCSFLQTIWTLLYYDATHVEPDAIRTGTPVTFWQPEIAAFLSAAPFEQRYTTQQGADLTLCMTDLSHDRTSETEVYRIEYGDNDSDQMEDSLGLARPASGGPHHNSSQNPGFLVTLPREMSRSLTSSYDNVDIKHSLTTYYHGQSARNLKGKSGSLTAENRKGCQTEQSFGGKKLKDFLSKLQTGAKQERHRYVAYFYGIDAKNTTITVDELDVHSNSLWIIEGVDPIMGGPCNFNDPYRLRHLATNQYLGIIEDSDSENITMKLCLSSNRESDDNVFRFITFDAESKYVQNDSFFVIQHIATNLFLHFFPNDGHINPGYGMRFPCISHCNVTQKPYKVNSINKPVPDIAGKVSFVCLCRA